MWFKSDVMSAVETAMKQRAWKYARVDRETVLTAVTVGAGAVFIQIRNDEARRTLLFLMGPTKGAGAMVQAVMSGMVPFLRVHVKAGHSEAHVAQVCEALLALNYRSLLGNLERDDTDGEVRLRVAVPYRDTAVTAEQVNWCVDIGVGSLSVAVTKIEEILGREVETPLEEV